MQRALITSTSTHYLQVQQNLQIEKCHDFIFFLHSYIPFSEKGRHLFSFWNFQACDIPLCSMYYIFSLYPTHWKSLKYFLHSTIAYKLRTYLIQCTCSLLEKKRECHSNYIISFKKIVMLSWISNICIGLPCYLIIMWLIKHSCIVHTMLFIMEMKIEVISLIYCHGQMEIYRYTSMNYGFNLNYKF